MHDPLVYSCLSVIIVCGMELVLHILLHISIFLCKSVDIQCVCVCAHTHYMYKDIHLGNKATVVMLLGLILCKSAEKDGLLQQRQTPAETQR